MTLGVSRDPSCKRGGVGGDLTLKPPLEPLGDLGYPRYWSRSEPGLKYMLSAWHPDGIFHTGTIVRPAVQGTVGHILDSIWKDSTQQDWERASHL